MTPTVRILRQTDDYIDIHLDAGMQQSSQDTPGRSHTVSSEPMPVLLQLGVDKESFMRSMVIRVGVIQITAVQTDLNSSSHDTTLIDVDDIEPSPALSESSKSHSPALQFSPKNPSNHCTSPSGSQTLSQGFDFTLTTQDSQLLSTQTANFLYMCEEREDLIADRAARAIDTVSGKYFFLPTERIAEISYYNLNIFRNSNV
ncbi:hypothetical protein PM082_001776 [Marasmius tenuissimus]|nr:hypothetical protein PM082_001776 [Marasmius tenuissimus]